MPEDVSRREALGLIGGASFLAGWILRTEEETVLGPVGGDDDHITVTKTTTAAELIFPEEFQSDIAASHYPALAFGSEWTYRLEQGNESWERLSDGIFLEEGEALRLIDTGDGG